MCTQTVCEYRIGGIRWQISQALKSIASRLHLSPNVASRVERGPLALIRLHVRVAGRDRAAAPPISLNSESSA